jgi:hypothetical protein
MAPPALTARTVVVAHDFSWPDFDRWQAFFTEGGSFPDRWDGLHVPPPHQTPEAEVYRQRKLELFSEWRDLLGHRANTLAHYVRQGMRARIARQHEAQDCPVCDPFNAREVEPRLDTLPPFHPGCRCVVLAVHSAPARRRARAYQRPRSRAG